MASIRMQLIHSHNRCRISFTHVQRGAFRWRRNTPHGITWQRQVSDQFWPDTILEHTQCAILTMAGCSDQVQIRKWHRLVLLTSLAEMKLFETHHVMCRMAHSNISNGTNVGQAVTHGKEQSLCFLKRSWDNPSLTRREQLILQLAFRHLANIYDDVNHGMYAHGMHTTCTRDI